MKARIATFEELPADLDMGKVDDFREWLSSQPGFEGGLHLSDAETGAAISLTLWDEERIEEADAAAEERQATHPPVGMPQPVSVVYYDVAWKA